MKYSKTLVPAVVVGIMALSTLFVIAQPNQNGTGEKVTVTTTSTLSAKTTIPVTVLRGSQFTITLPSNATTGFSWRIAGRPNSSILRSVGNRYNAPSDGLVGQGGTETWTFRAVGKGILTLKMEYARPWEKSTPPAKTQTFGVTVP